MENEIIQTVLTEVLEELKEVRRQQIETNKALHELRERVTNPAAISNSKKPVPPGTNFLIISTIHNGLQEIQKSIEAQPKTIRKEFRILLFPEYHSSEYYKLVFGRLLFWMLMFLTATYLYFLGKEFIKRY